MDLIGTISTSSSFRPDKPTPYLEAKEVYFSPWNRGLLIFVAEFDLTQVESGPNVCADIFLVYNKNISQS